MDVPVSGAGRAPSLVSGSGERWRQMREVAAPEAAAPEVAAPALCACAREAVRGLARGAGLPGGPKEPAR